MANLITRVKTSWTAAYKSWVNDDGFGADMSVSRNRYGRTIHIPGTQIDWDALTGDLWSCPTVQSCLNWIFTNFVQAPPMVRTKNADGEYETVTDSLLPALLTDPNPDYDGTVLWMGVLLSWFTNGNAYIGIERDRAQQVAELYWLPHHMIKPKRFPNSTHLVDYYEYTVRGQKIPILAKDMIHLRYGLDPHNVMLGMAPLASASRGVYTMQQAGNYTANIMRNNGAVAGIVSPDGEQSDFDADEFVRQYERKHQGDQVGRIFATNFPVNLQFPKNSPQEMALATITDMPQSDICALFPLAPQVVNLHVGRLSKTYANAREAREAAWEECVIPTQIILGRQIGRQILPQMSANAAAEEVAFDTSDIRPLQPDLDALHDRARDDFALDLIDRAQWKQAVGMKPMPEDKGVYYSDLQPEPPPRVTPVLPGKPGKKPTKREITEAFKTYYGDRSRARRLAIEAGQEFSDADDEEGGAD